MPWQIQQSVHVCNRHPFWTIGDSYDVIARTNFAFLQNAKVKPWSVVCHKQSRHTRFIHANAHSVAGYARLGHFKYCVADAVPIADADLSIRKTIDREIFSELTEAEVVATQELLPVVVGVHLVDKYGALLPTMTSKVPLPVALNIELAHHPPVLHRRFPDRRSDGLAFPSHIAWKADIY